MKDPILPTDWIEEDKYWKGVYSTRPYAGTESYDYYRPGYRYGYESARRHEGRTWAQMESELERGWGTWEHRGESTWEQVKHAVRDAWDRVTGRNPVGTR